MGAYGEKNSHRDRHPWRRSRRRQRSLAEERPAKFGTYRERVAISRDVARARFAAFVKRALRDARARGMNDAAIERATGIGASTFHRWQRGEGTKLPALEKVQQFCRGLDIPVAVAYAALGIDETRQATPESPLDPDLRRLARVLADPAVSDAEKEAIRHTIRALSRAALTEQEITESRRTDRTGNTGRHVDT